MLFCHDCGQCIFISDDHFIEYVNVSGSQTRYLNAETGDAEDHGDTDLENTGGSTLECPYCGSESVTSDWEGTEDEALKVREVHEAAMHKMREDMLKLQKLDKAKESMKKTGWDVGSNEVFK